MQTRTKSDLTSLGRIALTYTVLAQEERRILQLIFQAMEPNWNLCTGKKFHQELIMVFVN